MEIPPSIFSRASLDIEDTLIAKKLVFRNPKDLKTESVILAIGESSSHNEYRYYAIEKEHGWIVFTPDEIVKLKNLNDRLKASIERIRSELNDTEIMTDNYSITEDEIICERTFKISERLSVEAVISVTRKIFSIKYRKSDTNVVFFPKDIERLYTAMCCCRYIHSIAKDFRKACEDIERSL